MSRPGSMNSATSMPATSTNRGTRALPRRRPHGSSRLCRRSHGGRRTLLRRRRGGKIFRGQGDHLSQRGQSTGRWAAPRSPAPRFPRRSNASRWTAPIPAGATFADVGPARRRAARSGFSSARPATISPRSPPCWRCCAAWRWRSAGLRSRALHPRGGDRLRRRFRLRCGRSRSRRSPRSRWKRARRAASRGSRAGPSCASATGSASSIRASRHWLETAFRDLQAARPGTALPAAADGRRDLRGLRFPARADCPPGALCVALNHYHNMGPGHGASAPNRSRCATGRAFTNSFSSSPRRRSRSPRGRCAGEAVHAPGGAGVERRCERELRHLAIDPHAGIFNLYDGNFGIGRVEYPRCGNRQLASDRLSDPRRSGHVRGRLGLLLLPAERSGKSSKTTRGRPWSGQDARGIP